MPNSTQVLRQDALDAPPRDLAGGERVAGESRFGVSHNTVVNLFARASWRRVEGAEIGENWPFCGRGN